MGPKISEAKTPPLRKPVSLLSPLFLPTQFSLSFLNASFPLKHTKSVLLFFFFWISKPLPAICISLLFLLSASSNFKHAYGGRMCLRATCASLRRLPSLSSSAIVLFLSFCWIFPPAHHSIFPLPSLLLSACICLAYSSFHLSPGPCIIVTHMSPTHARSTHHWAHDPACATRNAQTGAHGQKGSSAWALTELECFSPAQQHIALMQSCSPY